MHADIMLFLLSGVFIRLFLIPVAFQSVVSCSDSHISTVACCCGWLKASYLKLVTVNQRHFNMLNLFVSRYVKQSRLGAIFKWGRIKVIYNLASILCCLLYLFL